ncbi:hypothetical protein MWU59_06335 [Flavobacteriaceae bacterium F08102]|nr:hypothetical protein [Flavobacteriaceae bacterium F08102]
MKKLLLLLITTLYVHITVYAQEDYANVVFKSKIYAYKDVVPRTTELGVNRDIIAKIIDLLGADFYNDVEKHEIVNKAWLALTNPKMFDFVYKDFAVKTIKNWGYKNEKGELVLEPNPYLTEWTISDKEFPYFQLALSKILEYFKLITYGDDAEGVKSSFNELKITQNLKFQDPTDDDWAYSYLTRVNTELNKKGLVALVTKGYYNIIVCKLEQKQTLTDLFKKLEWDFIQP